MLEAMDQAAEAAQAARSKPFHLDVQYIFVEKDAEAVDYLRSVLAESKFAPLIGDRIQLIQGEFTAQVPVITELPCPFVALDRSAATARSPAQQTSR